MTNAAWQTLLPTYFQWVPIDPTTESQSQNFNNFYPRHPGEPRPTPLEQLEAMEAGKPYSYPGFSQTGRVLTAYSSISASDHRLNLRDYIPTSMAASPAASVSGGGTAQARAVLLRRAGRHRGNSLRDRRSFRRLIFRFSL